MKDEEKTKEQLINELTEQRLTEAAVREAKEYTENALNILKDIFFVFNSDGRFLRWNKAMNTVTGYNDEEISKMKPFDFFVREDIERVTDAIEKAVKQGYAGVEATVITKDRKQIPFEFTGSLLKDPEGKINISGVGRDITERKETEEALRQSEERFKLIEETIAEVFWMADVPIEKMFYVSPGYERIWKRTRKSLYENPRSFIDAIHPEDREQVLADLEVKKDGKPFDHEYRIIWPDGAIRWIWDRGFPVRDKTGRVTRYVGIARDIAERKQAQEALQKAYDELENRVKERTIELSTLNDQLKAEIEVRGRIQEALEANEERYKRMVSAVTAYTYSVEVRKGHTIYTEHSIGCLPITGYAPEDYKSDPHLWYLMIYSDDKKIVENSVREILSGHQVPPIEHRIVRRDGVVVWVRNTIVPYYDENGQLVRYDGLIENITERKLSEDKIQKLNEKLKENIFELTEANKELDAFNYTVSHDLQEPLMIIGGFTNRLLKISGHNLDEKEKDLFNIIKMNTQKMERLIHDLLSFSRSGRQEIKPEEIDMEDLVTTVLGELKPVLDERMIDFKIKALPKSYGDRTLIKQVLVNLLSNAIKFTRPKDTAVIEVGCKVEENEDVYYVKDNGIGFYSQNTDKLFFPFYRLPEAKEFKGTGIGLSIVQRIVNRHGGRVWAEGRVSEGTTFYFSLPKNV